MAGPTTILIKRSQGAGATDVPASLANGELAYTSNGDVLFIGIEDAVVPIGGERTPGTKTANQALTVNSTGMIDTIEFGNSTVNVTANSLSIRFQNSTVDWQITKPTAAQVSTGDYILQSDGSWAQPAGGVSELDGLSDVTLVTESNNQIMVYDEAATQWENHTMGDGFVFTAHDVAVDGANGITVDTAGVNVDAEDGLIANVTGLWVEAGTDGGLSVNSTGVWADAANGVIVTAAGINVNTGTNGGLLANVTGVWIDANNGVTTDADGLKAVVGDTMTLNTTGIHVNSDLTITDLTLSGNLTVQGTLTTIDTTNLLVEDPLIILAKEQANSASFTDTADIGFVGSYGNTTQTQYTGVFRDTSEGDNRYKIFDASDDFPDPTTTIDTANVNFALANLEINALFLGVGLAGTEGGTGRTTNVDQDVLVANSTNGYDLLTAGANGTILQVVDGALAYDGVDGGTF